MSRITTPLKWHGGKHYLAPKLVALMPPHTHYVEPFAGGLSVLLAKDPEGVSEVVNDLDEELSNFWSVLSDRSKFEYFYRRIEILPFSEWEWKFSNQDDLYTLNSMDRAIRFFVHCRQSLAGRRKCFAPLSRNRTRRGMNEQVSAWMTAVAGLPQVAVRLRRVAVLCRPAVNVIRSQDGPNTLFYCDPPYLHETRQSDSDYECEMSESDHEDLLATLLQCKGKVMLSGYGNDMYNRFLLHWNRTEFYLPNNAAGGAEKRRMKEVVWMNW